MMSDTFPTSTAADDTATMIIIMMGLASVFCLCIDVCLTNRAQDLMPRSEMLVGFSGLKGAGKDTAAKQLTPYGFKQASFAGLLKDIVSMAFSWDRCMLEGATLTSRAKRKRRDSFWASTLNDPSLTPVKALQVWGTNLVRNTFHPDFWVHALFRRIECGNFGSRVAITDVRFSNAAAAIYRRGGVVIHIERGTVPEGYRQLEAYYEYHYVTGAGDCPPVPEWFAQMLATEDEGKTCDMDRLQEQFPGMPHESEWRSLEFVYRHRCPIIKNNGSEQALKRKIMACLGVV